MRTRLRNVRTVSAVPRSEKWKKPFQRARLAVFAALFPRRGRPHRGARDAALSTCEAETVSGADCVVGLSGLEPHNIPPRDRLSSYPKCNRCEAAQSSPAPTAT